MSVVVTNGKITAEQLSKAREEYGDFIKVVVDIETGKVAAGGEWHVDAEKVLLELGSDQDNLWGGGVDLVNKQVTYSALINMRPEYSKTQEILDADLRELMKNYIRQTFGEEYE